MHLKELEIKIYAPLIITAIIIAGCSTSTYYNLNEESRSYIEWELEKAKNDNERGAVISLKLTNGELLHGELLSARENSLIICTELSANEDELTNFKYPIVSVKNNRILEITIEGHSYVWPGIITGDLIGSLTGYLIVKSTEKSSNRGRVFAEISGIIFGGMIGIAAGGITGYALSSKEYILRKIPSDYDLTFLKPLAHYPNKEPAYLKTLK